MDLSKYDGKHVRITDKWNEVFTGMAKYANADFLECEYGGEEDGIFIEDCLIYRSQIVSIEEIEVHGTVELRTEHLVLRRYRPEDAEVPVSALWDRSGDGQILRLESVCDAGNGAGNGAQVYRKLFGCPFLFVGDGR